MATMKTKNVNNSPYSFLTFIYYQPKSSDETRTISAHVNVTNLTTRNIFAMLTMATTNSEKKITTRRKSSSNAYVFFSPFLAILVQLIDIPSGRKKKRIGFILAKKSSSFMLIVWANTVAQSRAIK